MERVSVVIPTYNRAPLLRRAVKTAIEALKRDDEIIIVDDGSSDDTAKVPAEFDRDIRYISLQNGGAGAARNAGVEAASNDLIGFIDSDDEWLPARLDQQRPLMTSRKDLAFSFTDFGQLFPDGHIEHNWGIKWHRDRRSWDEILGPGRACSAFISLAPSVDDVLVHTGTMYLNELRHNYINVNTVLVRRSVVGKAFRFGEGLPTYEDWECFARISRQGLCAYLDAETALQRTHSEPRLTDADAIAALTARLSIIGRTWALDDVFMDEHGEEVRTLVQTLRKQLTRTLLYRGQFSEARLVAADLDSYTLESLIARIPSPILKSLLNLYLAMKRRAPVFGSGMDGQEVIAAKR